MATNTFFTCVVLASTAEERKNRVVEFNLHSYTFIHAELCIYLLYSYTVSSSFSTLPTMEMEVNDHNKRTIRQQ